MLLSALQTMRTFGIDPAGAAAETSGLIHLGRSWRGSGHEAISDSRISTLLEMLQRFDVRYLRCSSTEKAQKSAYLSAKATTTPDRAL